MKAIFVGNTGFSLYHFRIPLMKELMQEGWEVVAISKDEKNFAAKLATNGIRFIDISLDHKSMNPISDFLFILKLKRVYEMEKPLLVHHFTVKPVIYGSLAARLAKVPAIVNTITGLGYSFDKGGWLQRLVEILYRIALKGRIRTIFQNIISYLLLKVWPRKMKHTSFWGLASVQSQFALRRSQKKAYLRLHSC